MPDTGLQRFWNYIKDVKSIIGWVGKGALVAPLVSLITDIGPPWPSRISVPVLTCLVLAIVLIYVFHFWARISKRKLESRMKRALIIIPASFISYLFLFSSFVVDGPGENNRVIKGFVYTYDAASVIGPGYSETQALRGALYDPTKIWVPWSVNTIRLGVLLSWMVAFSSVSIYLASFVLLQHALGRARAV